MFLDSSAGSCDLVLCLDHIAKPNVCYVVHGFRPIRPGLGVGVLGGGWGRYMVHAPSYTALSLNPFDFTSFKIWSLWFYPTWIPTMPCMKNLWEWNVIQLYVFICALESNNDTAQQFTLNSEDAPFEQTTSLKDMFFSSKGTRLFEFSFHSQLKEPPSLLNIPIPTPAPAPLLGDAWWESRGSFLSPSRNVIERRQT